MRSSESRYIFRYGDRQRGRHQAVVEIVELVRGRLAIVVELWIPNVQGMAGSAYSLLR